MSHKVHPKILRIKETKDWSSRGFYHNKLPQYLEEDFRIREYLKKILPAGIIEAIEIERSQTMLKVIIKTARPALVIGRGGKGVEVLKDNLIKIIKKIRGVKPDNNFVVKIDILEVRSPWTSAALVGQWVAGQIEKMVPFRRVLKMSLSKVMENRDIKGARIQVAGRLNGVDISRTEWLKEGKMPRQTLRSVIDYSFQKAHCTYGVIGVKVWLYKGEKFD